MEKLPKNDQALHLQFSECGKRAKEWMKKCVFLLPEIERRQIWRKKGFLCIYEYAAKIAGMSREKVDDSLRILRRLEEKPILRKVAEEKGVGAVRPVLTVSNGDNEEFWAEKATNMSIRTLETYVREYRNSRHVTESDHVNPQKKTITMELETETADKLAKLKGLGEWNTLMNEFIAMKERELGREKPEAVHTDGRYMNSKIKKYVLLRSGGICEYPRCKKHGTYFHHTERFSSAKTHDPDKIFLLCSSHHELAHNGLIENERAEPPQWRIRENAKLKFEDLMFMRIRSEALAEGP